MSACKNLDSLVDSVSSAASAAVDGIVNTITNSPTSGTAASIGAKISSAINTVKSEASSALESAKGAVATFEQTLMEFAEETQAQIAALEQQMIGAADEVIAELRSEIEGLKSSVEAMLPSWMHKSPEELLQDAISGICDPAVDGLVVPNEGTAKKIQPSVPPTTNPAATEVQTFAAPSKPPLNINPIQVDPETGVTP
jgi:hypothetical protein